MPVHLARDFWRRMSRSLVAASLMGLCWSCATTTSAANATGTLRAAAAATAHAKSFTLAVEGADVTYQAPDLAEQVEHGVASESSSSSGGVPSTSGSYAETIIKVFIGDRYYEGDAATGQHAAFSVSQRCAGEPNAAEYALAILRSIASSSTARTTDAGFAFDVPKRAGVPYALTGTAMVVGGYVTAIHLGGTAPTIEIRLIDSAPPVTAPPSASPANVSCSSNDATGGVTASGSSASP